MFPFFLPGNDGPGHLRNRILLLTIAWCLWAQPDLQAQISLEREREVAVAESDSVIVLDTWIVPGTFRVTADTLALSDREWSLYPVSGRWSWDVGPDRRAQFDTLRFRYEYRPMDLPVAVYGRELILPDTTDARFEPDAEVRLARRPLRQQDLFDDTRLQRSGSLRRGFVAGTNQDLSLESGLHFEISGQITDDIEVVASLTDRSTPIQPDGTTQTLREFDQVYIRLMHEMGMLQMGDIDMRLDRSNFAVIDRRLQGAGLQADLNRYGSYEGSAAVVRGQYREMQFTGEDGVQGPYRLSGAENEQFIIVLAGSERVYINGERMTRGEENDYVIDYGLGEITFTSDRIITDHSRITVDFQYLRDAYTRSVVAAEAQLDHLLNDRVSFGVSVIREADNVNLSTQLFLTDQEREVLRQAGDDPDRAVVSGADSVGFRRDADFLLYSRVDTLFQGQQYRIFQHIPGDSSGVFRVQFSRVPEGEGDYRRVGRAANGILYEWAGPGLGNYMPQRRLSRPVEQSMVALRSRLRATRNLSVYGEWAGSYFDRNRLSSIDNENNNDMSFLAGVRLDPVSTRIGAFSMDVRGRYEGEHFAYFDRVREIEFDRRWNLARIDVSQEERLEGTARLAPAGNTHLDIGAGMLRRGGFQGLRGDLHLVSREEGLPGVDYRAERIESEDRNFGEDGHWWRQRGRVDYDISLPAGNLLPEIEFEHEERLMWTDGAGNAGSTGVAGSIGSPGSHVFPGFHDIQGSPGYPDFQESPGSRDSLLAGSLRFVEVGPGLFYELSDRLRIGSSIRYRKDEGVIGGELVDESSGITQRYVADYSQGSLFQTRNTVGVRQRRFEEIFRVEQQRLDSRGVLVRSVTDYRPFNRFIDTQLLYDANTERRALLQEAFIEVGPELGQYVWIDLNDDGVQQVDEFFPEQSPNEGSFIKQLVPSEELFPVIALRVRWRAAVDPAQLIDPFDARYSSWLNFLSGIRWQSLVDIREENRTEQLQDIYLMRLHRFRDDSLTINGRIYIEQDVELFRNNTRRELRVTADRMRSQQQQASGLEKRRTDNLRVRAGGRISRRYRLIVGSALGRNENRSETFASRNYAIRGGEVRPRLDVRWTGSLQSGASLAVSRRTDRHPENPATVSGLTMLLDSRASLGRRLQSAVRLEHRRYSFSGGPSSSMGEFELTDGAGPGNTWAWSLQSDYRISDFLRASLQYDGRTVPGRPAIQTLRFTVNAIF